MNRKGKALRFCYSRRGFGRWVVNRQSNIVLVDFFSFRLTCGLPKEKCDARKIKNSTRVAFFRYCLASNLLPLTYTGTRGIDIKSEPLTQSSF